MDVLGKLIQKGLTLLGLTDIGATTAGHKSLYVNTTTDAVVMGDVPTSGGISDGDKGDITVSSGGTAWTIDDEAVTFDKMQNVSTNRVLARSASGVGPIEQLTLPNFRTLINVEDGATADQTDAEIKTAYESNADTNAFTDTEKTKLAGVEASATADQTDAEIKTAYETNADTNAFTDAEKTKLGAIEAFATEDQTDTEIEDAYNAQVPIVSQAEAETGTSTVVRRWTAERIKQAILALGGGGGGSIVVASTVGPVGALSGNTTSRVTIDLTGSGISQDDEISVGGNSSFRNDIDTAGDDPHWSYEWLTANSIEVQYRGETYINNNAAWRFWVKK